MNEKDIAINNFKTLSDMQDMSGSTPYILEIFDALPLDEPGWELDFSFQFGRDCQRKMEFAFNPRSPGGWSAAPAVLEMAGFAKDLSATLERLFFKAGLVFGFEVTASSGLSKIVLYFESLQQKYSAVELRKLAQDLDSELSLTWPVSEKGEHIIAIEFKPSGELSAKAYYKYQPWDLDRLGLENLISICPRGSGLRSLLSGGGASEALFYLLMRRELGGHSASKIYKCYSYMDDTFQVSNGKSPEEESLETALRLSTDGDQSLTYSEFMKRASRAGTPFRATSLSWCFFDDPARDYGNIYVALHKGNE